MEKKDQNLGRGGRSALREIMSPKKRGKKKEVVCESPEGEREGVEKRTDGIPRTDRHQDHEAEKKKGKRGEKNDFLTPRHAFREKKKAGGKRHTRKRGGRAAVAEKKKKKKKKKELAQSVG